MGGCTFKRTSAEARIAAASLNSTSVYRASGKCAAAPASRSISTRTPSGLEFRGDFRDDGDTGFFGSGFLEDTDDDGHAKLSPSRK